MTTPSGEAPGPLPPCQHGPEESGSVSMRNPEPLAANTSFPQAAALVGGSVWGVGGWGGGVGVLAVNCPLTHQSQSC